MTSFPAITNRLRHRLVTLLTLASLALPLIGGAADEETTKEIVDESPDGKYAFLYTEGEGYEGYDLIDKKSGKVLMNVAGSDLAVGPGQFEIDNLLWRPDSKAFALTVWLERRASTVLVFVWDKTCFRKVELPELEADITSKLKAGKVYDHVNTNNSQSAESWKKGGSLVVLVTNIMDSGEGSVGARRTVELAITDAFKTKIVKSSTKYTVTKEE